MLLFDSIIALSISFSQVNYVVSETVGMVNVCVVLNVVASRDITITLSDVAGTASPGNVLPDRIPVEFYTEGLNLLLVCLSYLCRK